MADLRDEAAVGIGGINVRLAHCNPSFKVAIIVAKERTCADHEA